MRLSAGLAQSRNRFARGRLPHTSNARRFPVGLVEDMAGLSEILVESTTIAVVGLSANWHRPSFFAAKYMQDHGYRIIPVTPSYPEILGRKSVPALAAIDEPVDIVDCFRKPVEMPQIAREAVAIRARVLWMQIGVINDEAVRIPTQGGLAVRVNHCAKVHTWRL